MSEAVSVLDRRAHAGTIEVAERGPVGMVTLKGDLAAMAEAVKDATGLAMPEVWQASVEGETAVVWMAPDEVLIVTGYGEAGDLVTQLSEALSGQHHMAVNVSDARVVLRLTGDRVAEVLNKGAPVDLSEGAFPAGSARRTHLGPLAVAFWRRDAETWDIVAFRSFGQYLFDWLAEQSRPGSEVF